MTYTKPELVALTHAVEAIQGLGKQPNIFTDGKQPEILLTLPAYEADE